MRDQFRTSLILLAAFLPSAVPAQEAAGHDGALLAQACVTCHGADLSGGGRFPGLAGRDAAELVTLMTAFREGGADGTIMPRLMSGYSVAEIAALAEYLSTLEVAP